jgi:ADP-ribose pyrophosphatase YjhB (NUDIX family)
MVDDDFPRAILTIDVILLTLAAEGLRVALVPRAAPPFAGRLALVGGYVHVQEDVDAEAAARRILTEKAGSQRLFLEQLQTFSGAARDPRGWSATIAYYALSPWAELARTAKDLVFRDADDPGPLAFDHSKILRVALDRLRGKGAYSTLPAFLLPPSFTLGQLREVYERVMGESLNESAFRRKITELDFLERVEGEFSHASDRPAMLYRLKTRGLQAFDRKIGSGAGFPSGRRPLPAGKNR